MRYSIICMTLFAALSICSISAAAEGKVLNNLVTELVNVQSQQEEPQKDYTFTNPRDGWIFISSTVSSGAGGTAALVIDPDSGNDTVTVHEGGDSVKEAMRRLSAGEHTLSVRCEDGASLQGLIVRSIPEIIHASVGYWTRQVISTHAPFTWEFLEAARIPENINVVLERHRDMGMDVEKWRSEGKKILGRGTIHEVEALGETLTADNIYKVWTESNGFTRDDMDGIMFDELDGYPSPANTAQYAEYNKAAKRLAEGTKFRNKVFYPYCNVMYRSEPSIAFVKELIKYGSKYTEDRYLPEAPTKEEAVKAINGDLRYVMTMHRKGVPDCTKHMIFNIGYMSAVPQSLNVYPGANYKVFLDMEMNLIANESVFKDLYGFMFYHSAYADEEIVRWSAKLLRHYCIEGRKDMLSTDPYELPHIQNADFAEGTTGWEMSPAEKDSMAVKSIPRYGEVQGRFRSGESGDTALWMKRSDEKPNVFSQKIKELKPGRLYSLKLMTADYTHLMEGKSVEQKLEMGIRISNAQLLPYRSFHKTYRSIRTLGDGKKKPWITYHYLVFRAENETAELKISDWVSDDSAEYPPEWGIRLVLSDWKTQRPGGPDGQELICNFIEIQPYLED